MKPTNYPLGERATAIEAEITTIKARLKVLHALRKTLPSLRERRHAVGREVVSLHATGSTVQSLAERFGLSVWKIREFIKYPSCYLD
jgi:hypothetical protein